MVVVPKAESLERQVLKGEPHLGGPAVMLPNSCSLRVSGVAWSASDSELRDGADPVDSFRSVFVCGLLVVLVP